MVLQVVHAVSFDYTCDIRSPQTGILVCGLTGGPCSLHVMRGLQTLRCGLTSVPCCQVSLYLLYNGSPDVDMCPSGGPWSQVLLYMLYI